MEKIVVAIKGSESCEKAAHKAEELAFLCQSSVTFLTVRKPDYKIITSEEDFKNQINEIEKEKKESQNFLDRCSTIYNKCKLSMADKNIKTDRVVIVGNHPAKDICDYAEDNNFDLIVVADKADKSIKKYLLGSVTEKIVRHSKISVLVIK